jgi:hypothetical protein
MKITSFQALKMLTILLSATLSLALFSHTASAEESKKAASKSGRLKQSYTWFDGTREQKVWVNPKLIAEFNPGPQGEKAVKSAYSSAKVFTPKHQQAGIRLWQVDNTSGTAPRNIKARDPQGTYSAVLHDGPSADSRMRALPGNVLVYFDPKWDEKAINAWVKTHNLQIVKKLEAGPNAYVIKTGSGLEALEVANALYKLGEVKAAIPDWWLEVTTK